MATNADRVLGLGCLLLSVVVFVYYTIWVIISPFVDADHFSQSYFPPRIYAIVIPTVVLVVLICGVSGFFAYVMIHSKAKKQKLS